VESVEVEEVEEVEEDSALLTDEHGRP